MQHFLQRLQRTSKNMKNQLFLSFFIWDGPGIHGDLALSVVATCSDDSVCFQGSSWDQGDLRSERSAVEWDLRYGGIRKNHSEKPWKVHIFRHNLHEVLKLSHHWLERMPHNLNREAVSQDHSTNGSFLNGHRPVFNGQKVIYCDNIYIYIYILYFYNIYIIYYIILYYIILYYII